MAERELQNATWLREKKEHAFLSLALVRRLSSTYSLQHDQPDRIPAAPYTGGTFLRYVV